MIPGYETENDRIRKYVKETLTPKQKLANWWDYHRVHVAFAGIVLLLIVYFVIQDRSMGPKADYSVCYVAKTQLSDELASEIGAQLAQYGEDLNGDGTIHVSIHQCIIDLDAMLRRGDTNGEKERANLTALEADMSSNQSDIFILEEPEAFQAYSSALLKLDGTEPTASDSWETMVINWQDCDAVNALSPGGNYYLGFRGCWKESQRKEWEENQILWQKILSVNNSQ